MTRIVLRGLSLAFAVSVLAILVVNASITSGCSRSDVAARDPIAEASAPPTPSASATAAAQTGTSVDASSSNVGTGSMGTINGAPSPRRLGGSKSGMVFDPGQFATDASGAW